MVALRKGHCYTPVQRAYTRKSKYKKHAFIRSVPQNKVVKYHMGDTKKEFDYEINLVSKKALQVRHNAIESSRQVVVRKLEKALGSNFYFNVRLFPHHVLRENKMITGAGADRMQTGMQLAFGRAVGLAAQVRSNQPIYTIRVNKEGIIKAKEALKMANARLPGTYNIQIKELKKN